MIAIRTVVCPVDFSAATIRQVRLAADVCHAFAARLVLHHNVTDLSVGAGVGWMWHADHALLASESADDRMREVVQAIPPGIAIETCLTRGAIAEGVLRVAEAAEADLVVLSAHAGKTEDHASVIEYLLEYSDRAVLALHDPGEDLRLPAFSFDDGQHHAVQSLLVPISLTGPAHAQADFACELARTLPFRLHLLHVIESHLRSTIDAASIRPRIEELIPKDLASRTTVHVEPGDPVPAIVQTARRISAACIVMGEHTRMPLKRWFTHDTSRAVLHEAPCPVWYVPSAVAATARSISRFALSDEKSILWGNV